MSTATETTEQANEDARLHRAMRSFVETYMPEDRRKAAQFEADLLYISHLTHDRAMRPFVKMIGLIPMASILGPKEPLG